MTRRALMRSVPETFAQCISTSPDAGTIDVTLARRQHQAYVEALQALGVEVDVLPALPAKPDCVFTEDTAIVAGEQVLGCNLHLSQARLGEEVDVLARLAAHGKRITRTAAPASIEGGDVLRHGDTFYVGQSGRTNAGGLAALQQAFPAMRVVPVPVWGALHLKTVATIAAGRLLLVRPGNVDVGLLPALPVFAVPDAEAHGANCVNINGTVLLPDDCPLTAQAVAATGVNVVTLPMSEFRKADGSLTCLSIRYTSR